LRTGILQFQTLTLCALDFMSRGGIYDHLGGGYARYATDEQWLVPHFEKMLYDNASLIDIMTLVWQHDRQPVLQTRIEETIGWVLREMRVEDAGFAASLDADSEGEEGRFYLWSEAEIEAILAGTDVARFKEAFGVTSEGNFLRDGRPSGLNVLHRVPNLRNWTQAEVPNLAVQRRLMFEAREKRVRPGRDDKVLVDWNGLMIAALANAGAAFNRSEWLHAARRAFRFVCEKLGDGGRLYHSYRAGRRQHPAFAEGYANMARAALKLWEATGECDCLEQAMAWAKTLDSQFYDAALGGYVFSKNPDLPQQARTRNAFDSQTPSANGLMIWVQGALFYATLEQHYGERANTLIQAFAGDVAGSYMQMATYLNAFEFCSSCLEIIVLGPPGEPRTQELIRAVLGCSLPNRLLITLAPGESLPPGHPAEQKVMQQERPTVYICGGGMCSPPVTDAAVLSQILRLPENRAPR
jgi:hypothetical protein